MRCRTRMRRSPCCRAASGSSSRERSAAPGSTAAHCGSRQCQDQIMRVVFYTKRHHPLSAGLQHRRDVAAERRMAALVRRRHFPVHSHLRRIVDRTEAQDHAVIGRRAIEVAFIPAGGGKAEVAYAAGRRLRREWHGDLQRPALMSGGERVATLVVEAKASKPVQTHPLVAHELRARVG